MPDDCVDCGGHEELSPEVLSCLKSRKDCGHHCNHSWTHDLCCWCGAEFGEEFDEEENGGG